MMRDGTLIGMASIGHPVTPAEERQAREQGVAKDCSDKDCSDKGCSEQSGDGPKARSAGGNRTARV
jgi:hypothetical protein